MENRDTVRLNDSSIYKCTHSSFVDRGFQHPFYLMEGLTDEVMKAEKKAYEKVIRMIAHEVNNTTAGITSTLDTVEQALSESEGMEDICDVMRVCTERCFSMSHFITRFADVVKIPEPRFTPTNLNDLAFTCKRFMEGMCNDRNIRLQLICDESLDDVKLDASLFEQVLVNIIKNAAESIGQDGQIIILLHCLQLSKWWITDPVYQKRLKQNSSVPSFLPTQRTRYRFDFIREVLSRHAARFHCVHTPTD